MTGYFEICFHIFKLFFVIEAVEKGRERRDECNKGPRLDLNPGHCSRGPALPGELPGRPETTLSVFIMQATGHTMHPVV